MTPAHEAVAVAVELRRTLLLPLDDLLTVVREFLCADVSRSGLDRCLRRHGVGNLDALKPLEPKAPNKACPIKIVKLLTDNGKEFTDRLFASRERQPSGQHEFDLLCTQLGIKHRLIRPRTPQTNGMVERFNGRIADVLKTHRFHSGEDLEQTLLRYVTLYNHQLPQSALKSKTPIQTMKDWYDSHSASV